MFKVMIILTHSFPFSTLSVLLSSCTALHGQFSGCNANLNSHGKIASVKNVHCNPTERCLIIMMGQL